MVTTTTAYSTADSKKEKHVCSKNLCGGLGWSETVKGVLRFSSLQANNITSVTMQ